ncbi:MAG TPA: hypothetical protein VFB34_01535 [Chloroflexota bacterium]|nr:hypothetical protein [Chloroflexota bacterium]
MNRTLRALLASGVAVLMAFAAMLPAASARVVATGGTGTAIRLTGKCSDFLPSERFPANDGYYTYLSWNKSYVYLGWLGGDTYGGDNRMAAFDLNPGKVDPVQNYAGGYWDKHPSGMADYILQLSGSYKAFDSRQDTTWHVLTQHPTYIENVNGSATCGKGVLAKDVFEEAQIPWTMFRGAFDKNPGQSVNYTVPSKTYPNGKPWALYMWYSYGYPSATSYGAMPGSHPLETKIGACPAKNTGNPCSQKSPAPYEFKVQLRCPGVKLQVSPNAYCKNTVLPVV